MRIVSASIFFAFSIGCAFGAGASIDPPDAGARSWRFTVLLDGRRIGEHDFAVVRHGQETVVDSEAHFQVKAAFITLYHYDHRDHEVWRDGCLAAISSRTQDDGKPYAVDGALQQGGFRLQGPHGAVTLPACIQTFAYWDAGLLARPRLLNPQTGQYEQTTLTRGGIRDITAGTQQVAARRFSLDGPKLAIQLWYSPAGDWLALESKLANGRILSYELQQP